eukprot:2034678-Lingulodinium_polyedra.AAC.1
MSAVPMGTWEQELEEYKETVPPTAGWRDQQRSSVVQSDLQGVRVQVWRASKRRAPPAGAAPVELLAMLLYPNRRMRSKGLGLGYQPDK